MRYYEEVLAQATRNYAFTSDKKWEQRYTTIELEADKLLKDAIKTCDKKDLEFFSTMDKANFACVEWERKAIQLVNDGKAGKAIKLLEGDEYGKQRKILAGGLENYVKRKEFESTKKEDVDHLTGFTTEPMTKIIEMERMLAVKEANIKTEKEKYQRLYDESPFLFRTIDLNGIIIDCNKSYADHLGYSKDELIGTPIFKTTAEQSHEAMQDSLETWKKTGQVHDREIWFKRKDGTIFPVLLSATGLYDENGELIGSNTAIRDMSEIYQARKVIEERNEQVREQFEKLKKSELMKEEFLAMITHELKTPLVPIKSYIDLLLSQNLGPINESQKQRLEVIKSSTQYLLRIISDLLDSQKLELGQLTLAKDTHNLADIINGIILKLKPNLDSHGIMITKNTQNLSCMCDRTRIEEVLNNLITNAVDFCPKEKGKIDIRLDAENGKYARIIVKDNGAGIQKSKIDKIFVKFFQIDTTRTREHGGTGLGLSICKGIIESHGGKIWAESEGTGKGTEIHILLPLTK